MMQDPRLAPGEDPRLMIGETEADAIEEIEHRGQFYRLPRALAARLNAQFDHDAASQGLAAERQALAERARLMELEAELAGASAQDRAVLIALEQQLAQFEGLDWQALSRHDPQLAQALWTQANDIAQACEAYGQALAQQDEMARAAAGERARIELEETGRVLAGQIEGWSPEVAAKLVEYAQAFGVTLEELREVADPRLWMILHRAQQGEAALKAHVASPPSPQVRPAVQLSGGSAPAAMVRDDMGAAEWMRRRNAQAMAGR
ncbi:MAG TPA: hypothetical protein PKB04_09990 [Phenylobacterium sp.]|nr:hypothetical protein [Phenylobacterium sp.]